MKKVIFILFLVFCSYAYGQNGAYYTYWQNGAAYTFFDEDVPHCMVPAEASSKDVELESFSLKNDCLILDAQWIFYINCGHIVVCEVESDTVQVWRGHSNFTGGDFALYDIHAEFEGFPQEKYVIVYHGMDGKQQILYTVTRGTSLPLSSATSQDDSAPYYDLLGRPVSHLTTGIYIRNGRKVMVR